MTGQDGPLCQMVWGSHVPNEVSPVESLAPEGLVPMSNLVPRPLSQQVENGPVNLTGLDMLIFLNPVKKNSGHQMAHGEQKLGGQEAGQSHGDMKTPSLPLEEIFCQPYPAWC